MLQVLAAIVSGAPFNPALDALPNPPSYSLEDRHRGIFNHEMNSHMSPRRMSVYAVPLAFEDLPAGHRELALHIHERGVLMPVNEAGSLVGLCIDNDGARVDPGGDVDSRVDSLLGAGISGHGLGFSVLLRNFMSQSR